MAWQRVAVGEVSVERCLGSWKPKVRLTRPNRTATYVALLVACACSDGKAPQGSGDPALQGGGTDGGGGTTTPAGGVGGMGGGGAGAAASAGTDAAGGGGSMQPAERSGSGGGGAAEQTDAAAESMMGGDAAVVAPAARGTGAGDWGPGDYPPELMQEEYLEISGISGQMGPRQYKVHVPASYDPDVPTPAVFCIHGLGQTPVMFCVVGADWVSTSDDQGFLLIMPFGYQNSWNAGTCCGGASTSELDEIALFRALLDEVGGHVNIDLDRVYATGLSNGGYMSYRLACEASDIFAAVAPGAGAIGNNDIGGGTNPASDFTECKPSQPISVLDVHGTADPLVPYSLQKPSLSLLAQEFGCGTTTAPASQPMSAGDTTCVSYEGCPDGIEIIGCSIEGGGHCWFGSEDCGTGGGAIGAAIVGANSDTMRNNDAIWPFFERHSL